MLNKIKDLKNHAGFMKYSKNTAWMFAARISNMVASLLVGIWVVRYLGPEQFGIYSYAMAFTALFTAIAGLGLDSIIVRNIVNEPDKQTIYLSTAFWLKIVAGIATVLLIMGATLLTSNSVTTNLYIFIIACGIVFQSFNVIQFYFEAKVQQRFVAICQITQLLIISLIKIYLVFTGAGLFQFVIVSLVGDITTAISLWVAYKYQKIQSFFFSFDRDVAIKLLRDSWPLVLSGIVISIYMKIDQVMIKEMLDSEAVGQYSVAVRLSEVWYFVPVIISSSLFPAIINAKKQSEELYYFRLQRLYVLMAWLGIAVALPMTFLAGWVVELLYGSQYTQATSVLMIHIWAGVFVALGVAQNKFWITNNLHKQLFFITFSCALINVLLNLLLIIPLGINGAAFATLGSYGLGSLVLPLVFKDARPMMKLTYQTMLLWRYIK